MRKADIINKVSLETGIDKSDVQETIEATIITIKKALVEGEAVFIRGFGSFENKISVRFSSLLLSWYKKGQRKLLEIFQQIQQ